MDSNPQGGIRVLVVVAATIWVLAMAIGYGLAGLEFAAGTAIGGALVLVNIQLLARAVARGLERGQRPPLWLAVLRWIGIGAVLMVFLWVLKVDPLGLLIGTSVVAAAVPVAAVTRLIRG